jgi:hypothetical protein
MRIATITAAIAGAGILFCSPASAKLLGRHTMIGNWVGGAYSSDETGRFSHCAASAPYRNGVNLLFMVNRQYEWGVGFLSPKFSLTKGRTIRVGLALDESREEIVNAYAVDTNFVRISLSPTSNLFKRFMRGNILRLAASDQSYRFDLQDTSRLLPFLLKCVRDRVDTPPLQAEAGQPTQNPREPSRPAKNGSPELRAEVTSLAANLLSEAGVRGFKIAPSAENASATWTSPSGNGSLLVMLDSSIKRPSDLTPRLISIAAEKCKGKFMSGAMPEENGAARSFSSCQIGSGEPLTGYYITLPRQSGGHYVIMMWPDDRAAASGGNEPDKDIRNAAYRVLR